MGKGNRFGFKRRISTREVLMKTINWAKKRKPSSQRKTPLVISLQIQAAEGGYFTFDISWTGGKAGKWRFIGRVINPSNHSDWLWVLGDDGSKISVKEPAFARPDHIIFEENIPPPFTWKKTGDFGKDGGTVNKLKSGKNIMMIWTRQSSLEVQYDVFCWSSDIEYQPTDDDYKKAKEKTLAVEPTKKLTTILAGLKK